MKIKALTCILMTAALSCPISALSASIIVESQEQIGQYFTVRVYKPYVNPQSGGIGDICYMGEIAVNNEGKIVIPFTQEQSGPYKYVMVSETGDEAMTISGTYEYLNEEKHNEAMNALKIVLQMPYGTNAEKISKVNALSAMLENDDTVAHLGLAKEFEVYQQIKSQDCSQAYNRMAGLMNDGMNADELGKIFKEAMVLCAVQNGESAVIKELSDNYKEEMGSTSSVINTRYDSLNEQQKNSIVNKIKAKTYNSTTDLAKDFSDAVAIEAMNGAENWQKLGEVIDSIENENVTALDFSSLTSLSNSEKNTVLQNLIEKKPFLSVEDLQTKLKTAIKNLSNDDNGGNNGGSGGGSSGSNRVVMPSLPNIPTTGNGVEFNDLDGVEWARKAIETLGSRFIISGRGDGSFDPMSPIKREEFVKILVLAAELPIEKDSSVSFSDIVDNEWYSSYIYTGIRNGIVSGISEELFGVGEYITRQDVAVMIARALKLSTDTVTENIFDDSESISDYARASVHTLAAMGIINGMGDGSFAPVKSISRAEAAQMIYNMLEETK